MKKYLERINLENSYWYVEFKDIFEDRICYWLYKDINANDADYIGAFFSVDEMKAFVAERV